MLLCTQKAPSKFRRPGGDEGRPAECRKSLKPPKQGRSPTHWDKSLVPLSTSRVSTTMPSMLMNSVAKVTSAESLASSFMASSRASMLDDWVLSISWRAARDYGTRDKTHAICASRQGTAP